MKHVKRMLIAGLLVVASSGCSAAQSVRTPEAKSVRWLKRSELEVSGSAPGATRRLLATKPDGSKDYMLALARNDEVRTALDDFAKAENVQAATFKAIGAVRDAEVGWFDFGRKEYKAMRFEEQVEVLSLVGDIGLSEEGKPAVHAHVSLGREDGSAFGGHLIGATVNPTLEVFVTTYPMALKKKVHADIDSELFDLPGSAPPAQ